jgi:hypothetical protein
MVPPFEAGKTVTVSVGGVRDFDLDPLALITVKPRLAHSTGRFAVRGRFHEPGVAERRVPNSLPRIDPDPHLQLVCAISRRTARTGRS